MNFLDVANRFIPGYQLLSDEIREKFQNSLVGKQFVDVVKNTQKSLNAFQNSVSFWRYIFIGIDEEKKRLKQEFDNEKERIISQISTSEEYKNLIIEIIRIHLPEAYSDFELLEENEEYSLASASFSHALLEIIPINHQLQQEDDEFSLMDPWQKTRLLFEHNQRVDALYAKKSILINRWQTQLNTSEDMAPFREIIEQKRQQKREEEIQVKLRELKARTQQLARVFPWLHSDPSILMRLQTKYREVLNEGQVDFPTIEEQGLTYLVFYHLQKITEQQFDYVTFLDFNLAQAKRLAKKIMSAFKQENVLNIDKWFTKYQADFTKELYRTLLFINNKKREISNHPPQEFLGSLSSLFWQNKTVEKTKEFLNRLADAHAFIQATGFSTQNESSFLAILDLYNYGRAADQITESKTILSSLFKPFFPLYEEYRDIAFYEKNVYLKILRTTMPLLVIAAFVTLIAALLAPLAIPELAFTVVLIPTLFVGLALATKYVALKDHVYKALREAYYGGAFEIPEFQINLRMLTIFKNEVDALAVRNFYIEEIMRCDEIEASYRVREQEGILLQEEIADKKANLLKRHTLSLEWYDIHSNINLGYEQVPKLVLARLEEAGNREYNALKAALEEDFPHLQRAVQEMVQDLKSTFRERSVTTEQTNSQRQRIIESSQENYSPRLFKPHKSLTHKANTEKLDSLVAEIRAC
ncbi:hypothetical protein [Legionella cardiaca]|uniref:Uncharacterized protein n=1 Tax=Legionella cardiaca TaxID=1071983 RepID=A0ABY8ASQ0_9GAMM|nr:hypothetical protein [Legionella cardiaca]WED43568.1 hypothetical protein PXX05_01980 [Legionella cardiaca]